MTEHQRARRTTLLTLAAALVVCAALAAAFTGCGEETVSPSDAVKPGGYPEYVSTTDVPSPLELTLSHESGVYAEPFNLSATYDGTATVFYTTDGSDPRVSDTRELYTQPLSVDSREGDPNVISATPPEIFDAANCHRNQKGDGYVSDVEAPKDNEVDKCTAVKFAALDENGAYTAVTTGTYFVGTIEEHIQGLAQSNAASGGSLAVISITMEYDDLFDGERGIYARGNIFEDECRYWSSDGGRVNGDARNNDANYKQRGREWEREAHVDVFECAVNGSDCVLSQDCGIRIQGNYSRSDLQKGFRLYARRDYGENNFDYPFFGESLTNDAGEVMDHFKTIVLRNGGNCAFTTKYSDTYWQTLVSELKVDTQTSRPCVVYLNGEYWGLYILQEDYSDDYFEDTHGVNKNDVVLYKGDAEVYTDTGYKLDLGELPEGVIDVRYYFKDLIDFFKSRTDLKSAESYAEFTRLVDPESVRDYFAVQLWINNKWDWPGKNWSMWRTVNVDESNPYADGRWRFCFYDMEFGGVSGKNDAYTNTIKDNNYEPMGMLDLATKNMAVRTWIYLMSNDAFRQDFYEKIKSLSTNELEYERAMERLDLFNDTYSPLYPQFFTRYYGTDRAESMTQNAIYGGYASWRCISDFLGEREKHIQEMLDWTEAYYQGAI